MFEAKMSCRRLEHLNHRSPSPVPASCGHDHDHGCVRGCAALNLEEEVPCAGEQHGEEPILEDLGAA